MALSIPSGASSAILSGGVVMRSGVVFDFVSGVYAFWDGSGPFTWGGVNFAQGGSLLEVSDIPAASDMSSSGVNVKLRAIPDSDLTPDVLGTVEAEQYHQRPVAIYAFFFDKDTGTLLAGIKHYSGYLDYIDYDDSSSSFTMTAHLESRSRDHLKTGYRTHTSADQEEFSPGDLFFQHVSTTANYTRKWGRA